jgi:hypothetical protein
MLCTGGSMQLITVEVGANEKSGTLEYPNEFMAHRRGV